MEVVNHESDTDVNKVLNHESESDRNKVVNNHSESGRGKSLLSERGSSPAIYQVFSSATASIDNDSGESISSNPRIVHKFKRIFPASNIDVESDDSSSTSNSVKDTKSTNDSIKTAESKTSEENSQPCDDLEENSGERELLSISGENPLKKKSTNETSVSKNISSHTPNDNGLGENSHDTNNEKSKKDLEDETQGIKIQMVTSINTNEVFVEASSGPPSPDVSLSNPLESDKDETRDSVASDVGKTGNNKSSSNSAETSKNDVSADKDNEQEEVITGDKTVSPEFVKTTLNTSVESRADAPQSQKESSVDFQNQDAAKDASGKRLLKVIYPKKKVTDISQVKESRLPIPLLKSCLQCSKVAKCDTAINIGGSEYYLCSEECLNKHKADQVNALQRKNCTAPPEPCEAEPESRICVNCDANVSLLPEDKVLSWETMEFCNEECLSKYQLKLWSFCTACKKDVPTSSMGKYCVRFGHEVKQFCSSSCLEDYKKGIKVCCYCQKDLSDGDGFLAPIGEKGLFKDFCSQYCLDEHYLMSNNMPGGLLKVEPCGVCDKKQLVQVQIINSPNTTVNLCSLVCLKAFRFVNCNISAVPCYMCKKFFNKSLPNCISVYYENEFLTFCSKACMNINILAKRKIVACNWCKVKKYNFDMIRRKCANGSVANWCSVNCIALYKVSMNVVNTTKSRKPCANCKKVEMPNFHLTMSDATVRNFCSMDCVTAYQTTFPSTQVNGVIPSGAQTKILLKPKGPTVLNAASPPPLVPSDSPVSEPSGTSGPLIQSHGAIKKPGEIKVISQAAVNGALQAALLSPGATAATSPQQLIKHQILILPPAKCPMRNIKTQTRPCTVSKAVTVRINKAIKSIQTDEAEEKGPVLIPVPVPIYVPCPMAMYSIPVPTPVPIPIPIPVPIFIPTTKGTADEILADIKRIQEQTPGNPYEAELLMMAEMAEGEKRSREDLTPSESQRGGLKRPLSDVLDEDCQRPDKKRREDWEDSSLESTFHHLPTSQLTMSLSETLAVSAWKHYAAQVGEQNDLLKMRPDELAQALKGFLKNAKIPSGGHYTPDMKFFLMLGIQYYLQENGRIDNIFYDAVMKPFVEALDEEARSFQNMFSPSDDIVTRIVEENLWESKQLGPETPYTLLASLIYFNTKYFNLTTVKEHMNLSFKDVAKHWKRNSSPQSPSSTNTISPNVVLRYITPEKILEENPQKKKLYEQEANADDPYRCPIQLYEFYLSKCPESVKQRTDLFYLSPERASYPRSPIWYSTQPLSEEIIERTLNRFRMVKEINISILLSQNN